MEREISSQVLFYPSLLAGLMDVQSIALQSCRSTKGFCLVPLNIPRGPHG